MVTAHDVTKDPQVLYAALLNHYTNSQTAVLRANKLRSEIVSSTIPATRPHTLTHYILFFYSNVHEYNKMVKAHNKMEEAQQLTHFKNFICSVTELEQTSTAIDILLAEKTLTPAVEIQLYKNYAERIGEATTPKLSRGNQRKVFESESVPVEVNAASRIAAAFEVNEAASSA